MAPSLQFCTLATRSILIPPTTFHDNNNYEHRSPEMGRKGLPQPPPECAALSSTQMPPPHWLSVGPKLGLETGPKAGTQVWVTGRFDVPATTARRSSRPRHHRPWSQLTYEPQRHRGWRGDAVAHGRAKDAQGASRRTHRNGSDERDVVVTF